MVFNEDNFMFGNEFIEHGHWTETFLTKLHINSFLLPPFITYTKIALVMFSLDLLDCF